MAHRQITTFDMANITTRKKKKDCVKKKKHRKAQNRDGYCTYQKPKVERSLNTKYDLAITVLYGEEVLKSQFQEMLDKEVAEWVKTVQFLPVSAVDIYFYHIY
ncbi:hypothetical protein Peur_024996 [Populus x canadensis]